LPVCRENYPEFPSEGWMPIVAVRSRRPLHLLSGTPLGVLDPSTAPCALFRW